MFQHLLVFLDGSQRAELALPVAARLAHATGASVSLVRMATLPPDFTWIKLEPPFRDQEILATKMCQASTYLKSKAWELEQAEIAVQIHLLPGLAFPQVQTLIEEEQIGLVLMCSRGQISPRSHTWSSMAWKMIQQCYVPVLVLQETISQQGTLSYRNPRHVRIMVPLDGSSLAETALIPAADLAAALSAPEPGLLHLINVLPFANSLQVEERIRVQQVRIWNDRQAYLQTTARMLCEGEKKHLNLSITTSVLTGPDITEALIGATQTKQPADVACDILALTTHGRSGPSHLCMGNVTERLLEKTSRPFLIVHPPCAVYPARKEQSSVMAL
jgi:nucleotide-binding universal stress UspA family protein